MDEPDEPSVFARHMLVCRGVDYNPDTPGAAYSLRELVEVLRPPDDYGYPLVAERLWLFTQAFGQPGEYSARVELYRIEDDAAGLEVLGFRLGGLVVRVEPGRFVTGNAIALPQVPFLTRGLYEFRLRIEGHDEPIVSERLTLEG